MEHSLFRISFLVLVLVWPWLKRRRGRTCGEQAVAVRAGSSVEIDLSCCLLAVSRYRIYQLYFISKSSRLCVVLVRVESEDASCWLSASLTVTGFAFCPSMLWGSHR